MAQTNTSLDLATVYQVIKSRRASIILLVVISMVIAVVVLLFLPRYYKSTAVVIPTNPQLNDKGALYNQHLQQLYSAFGTTDDLDRLYGLANLDTTYLQLADEFNLTLYYRTTNKTPAINRRNAALALKKEIELQRTDLNQLTIACYHKQPAMAAAIANRMVTLIQGVAQQAWAKAYTTSANQLDSGVATLEADYNALQQTPAQTPEAKALQSAKTETLLQQLKANQQLIYQLRQTIQNNQPALTVVQAAGPSPLPDRPKVWLVLLATFFASGLFGILSALVLSRKTNNA